MPGTGDRPPLLDYDSGGDQADGPPPPRSAPLAFLAFGAGVILAAGPVLYLGANLYLGAYGFSPAPKRPQPGLVAAFAAGAAAAFVTAVWWGYRGRRLRWLVMGLLLGAGVASLWVGNCFLGR